MNYEETINYLFQCVPMFQKEGGTAYKEGLSTTKALDYHLGHPHKKFKTIHVGGTNGKGSTSHTLAAILQDAGYQVGLYTSPHLIDFRERIRINGEPISKQYVVDFIAAHKSFYEPLSPSFFELTTALAFDYFAHKKIDVALIEVGLGGRLDCTNIIQPDLSIITNISNDHNQYLGSTLAEIAFEKAGIIKPKTPVVIGEYLEETKPIFERKAKYMNAPIYFAEDQAQVDEQHSLLTATGWTYASSMYGPLVGQLGGLCQLKNTNTILNALPLLQNKGYHISEANVRNGFMQVCQLTGLMGRWQQLQQNPRVICDTGHNVAGITAIVEQIKRQEYESLHIVLGMVNDKDIQGVLKLLPTEASYYFTQASIPRALAANELQDLAKPLGLKGDSYPSVGEATQAALANSNKNDFVFVGGSSFIVADLLSSCQK